MNVEETLFCEVCLVSKLLQSRKDSKGKGKRKRINQVGFEINSNHATKRAEWGWMKNPVRGSVSQRIIRLHTTREMNLFAEIASARVLQLLTNKLRPHKLGDPQVFPATNDCKDANSVQLCLLQLQIEQSSEHISQCLWDAICDGTTPRVGSKAIESNCFGSPIDSQSFEGLLACMALKSPTKSMCCIELFQ